MCKTQYAAALDKLVFPGAQGGPLMHVIAAKAVAFGEALHPSFMLYAKNVVENAKALAENLPTSGLAVFDFAIDDWADVAFRRGRLVQFLSPKLLKQSSDD